MANVDSFGQLIMRGGAVIPLANTATTEATLDEIQTDSLYVGSAQPAGTFATQSLPNPTIHAAGISCENDTSYCYIRSAGKIKAALPVAGVSSGTSLPAPLPYPVRLVSGDSVMVMANAVTDREVSLSVACSNGEYHVFAGTATTSGEVQLVSVLSGQSIGETLQGRTVTHAFSMLGDNVTEVVSPIYFLDGSGVPVGSVTPNNPAVDTGTYSLCRVGIALNTRAVIQMDA